METSEIKELGAAEVALMANLLREVIPVDYRERVAGKLLMRLAEEARAKGTLGPAAGETAASLQSALYVSEGGDKTPAQWLAGHWGRADTLFSSIKEQLIAQCRAARLQHVPVPVKEKGGRANRYYLRAEAIPAIAAQPLESNGEQDAVAISDQLAMTGAIRYARDMSPQLSRLGAVVFRKGRQLTMRRRVALILLSAVSLLLAVLGALLAFWWLFFSRSHLTPTYIVMATAALCAPYFAVKGINILADMVSLKYQLAPEWATSIKERCAILELEDLDLDKATAQVQVNRYTATCSVCGGMVLLREGQRSFHRRVIGSCAESPDEHIFTFDPKTRLGYPLRQRKDGYVGQ